MGKTTVVPLIFIIFGVILGVSSYRTRSPASRSLDFLARERNYAQEMNEPLVEARGHSNTKITSQRGYADIPQNSQPREPSIQAYGLPKRTIENNGHIERVNLDRVSGLDGKVDKVRNKNYGIQAYGLPKRIAEDNGVIERLGLNDREEGPSPSSESGDYTRRTRSIDEPPKDDLVDLEAQEAKVFRPLFVYRQQIADRYRLNPKKNPIYGSYQYGINRQGNSIPGSRKYNY